MTRLVPCVLLAASIVGCAKKPAAEPDAPAEKTYAIRLRDRVTGDRFAVTETGSGSTRRTEDFGDGKPQVLEFGGTHKYAYTEEYLDVPKPGELPTKARRTYTVAELTEHGKPVMDVAAFQGKAVLVGPDKDGRGYEFRVEPGGTMVSGAHGYHLFRHYNPDAKAAKPTELFPDRPVKVGESWQLDRAVVAARFGRPGTKLDPAKTTATGTLTKVAEKGGREFGTVEYVLTLALLDDTPPGPEPRVQPGSAVKYAITVELCLDGSVSDGSVAVTTTEDVVLRGTAEKLPREVTVHHEEREEITTATAK